MSSVSHVTVGIDIGTTSVKAVAVDAEGIVVARVRRPHTLVAPNPDRFEHDAATAWFSGVRAVWNEVRANPAIGGQHLAGVGIAAMVPSLCGVDADGIPVTEGLLYGDRRGSGAHGELAGFLRWLRAEAPRAAGFWPAQAVAAAALCGPGSAAIDSSTAMTGYPLFDGNTWSSTILGDVGISPHQLPVIRPTGTRIGTCDGAALACGTVDAFAEQLAAGADRPGDVHVLCGTTLITWAVNAEPQHGAGVWTVTHPSGHSMTGGPSNAGGLFVDRVRAILGSDPSGDDSTADVHPDRLPVWLPYLRGERTPLHDPDRRGRLVDLDLGHGRAHVLAAAYEATGFVVRHHLDLGSTDPKRIVATGGGVQSKQWMQALADCTGLPVDVAAHPEGAALGAAWLARMAAGLEDDVAAASRWARTRHRVEPRPDWIDPCNHRYERFLSETRTSQH